jgi:cytochrome c peroxidase
VKYRFIVILAFLVTQCLVASPSVAQEDPPEVTIGERLFLETRFAESFARASNGINGPFPADPVVDTTETTGIELPGPFAGKAINCRSCHLVDEHSTTPKGGMRAYADFARRSPIPARGDGLRQALRNSPTLVNVATQPALFHSDGEFATLPDLALGTLTGRNFGWLPQERQEAIAHIAKVIREDDGKGELASEFEGVPYRELLAGDSSSLPSALRLSRKYRVDVEQASDYEIVRAVSKLIAAYVGSLSFSTNERGEFNGSPFDAFLVKNNLPRRPSPGESPLGYSRKLRTLLGRLESPRYVSPADREFESHDHRFAFGPSELQGLMTFLRERGESGVGNCVSCHPAPLFTDGRFHNTGASQEEYEAIHGKGTFRSLALPSLSKRRRHPELMLPPTHVHPQYKGIFAAIPSKDRPGAADLGVWNVLSHPDMPRPQRALRKLLCEGKRRCARPVMLKRAIAAFKTPGLRDLGHSGPYLHHGLKDSIEEVVSFYRAMSQQARKGDLIAPAPELAEIRLNSGDVKPVVDFLRSLDEDYA